jgi:hypothetical protein
MLHQHRNFLVYLKGPPYIEEKKFKEHKNIYHQHKYFLVYLEGATYIQGKGGIFEASTR